MIAFDTITVNPTDGSSFTTSSINRILFYAIQGGTATSVTYNGVALTKLIDILDSSGSGFQLWYLLNPASGANTFHHNSSGSRHFLVSYNGVLQSGFPDSSNTNNTAANPKTLATTTVADNSRVIAFAVNASGSAAATVPLTARSTGTDGITIWADSNADIHPAGSYSSTVSFASSGSNQAMIVVSMAPFVGSSSVSPSLSPSASLSPSSSASASASRSASASASSSVSASLSPSSSASPSLSPSASASASQSPSSSASASPSPGFEDYTRQQKITLPTNDNDLTTIYTAQEVINVSTYDGIRVSQAGDMKYMLHQFKKYMGDVQDDPTVLCRGQSSLPAYLSTIYLQIYNQKTNLWETLDSDRTTGADTDFRLAGDIASLANYRDHDNVVSVRVYQLAI